MLYIDITRVYNNQRLAKRATGVDKVSYAYIAALQQKACCVVRLPNEWLFFRPAQSKKMFKRLLNHQKISLPKGIFKKFYSKPMQNEQNFYLNTAHSGLESPDFDQQLANYNLKGIYFLHDLIPIDYPEYCRAGEEDRHIIRLQNMAKGALVISNSLYTHNRFLAFCATNKLTVPQAIWAYLADDDRPPLKNSYLSSLKGFGNYFLTVGTIEGRKNHLLLLNVWRELQSILGENCPKLIIVGKRGWECEQVLSILDRSKALRNNVIEISDCDDEYLSLLMANTKALLFPSYVEGFGLPLIEAYRKKVPVIASDIPAFREISQDVCELISPIDGEKWIHAIIEYNAPSSNARQVQINKLSHIYKKLPTWHEHFEIVTPVIDQLLEKF